MLKLIYEHASKRESDRGPRCRVLLAEKEGSVSNSPRLMDGRSYLEPVYLIESNKKIPY